MNVILPLSRSNVGRIMSACVFVGAILTCFNTPVRDFILGAAAHKDLCVSDLPTITKRRSAGTEVWTCSFRVLNLSWHRMSVQAEPSCGCITGSWTRAQIYPFTWRSYRASFVHDPHSAGLGKVITFKSDQSRNKYEFGYFAT